MAFIQHCFIRMNSPYLRDRLRELGQRQNEFDDNGGEWLAANYGMFISVTEGFERLNPEDIDCGEDEELFLALAALRDDNDYMQWFICKEEYVSTHTKDLVKEGTWQLNTQYNKLPISLKRLWRKAKVEEIIGHFKR